MIHGLWVSIKLAAKNLRSNVGRTSISLLGIVLGVMSVIVVLSVGNGVKDFVVGQVESFGSDIIQIEVKVPKVSKTSAKNATSQVGGTQITTLKLEDAEEVGKMDNVSSWYAAIMSQQITSYEGKNKQAFLMGVTAGVTETDDKVEIENGYFFSEDDEENLKQVVVLGSDLKEYFFPGEEAVGKNIKIKDKTYRVVGTLKKRGASGFMNLDEMIYVPLRTLQKRVMGIDHVQFAIFRLKEMEKLDFSIAEATDIVREQHDIDDPDDDDFAVNSIVEIKEILDKVFYVINLLLLGLTSISLVVGGVGIMNVMYVAVTERNFEIGLRKSLGARKSDILSQFLFEAVFLTVLGGFFGIILGAILSYAISFVIAQLGFSLELAISMQSVVIGFGFSALAGIVFGLYPALGASRVTPMEALRKE